MAAAMMQTRVTTSHTHGQPSPSPSLAEVVSIGAGVLAAATAIAIENEDVLRFFFDPGEILGEIPIIGGVLMVELGATH